MYRVFKKIAYWLNPEKKERERIERLKRDAEVLGMSSDEYMNMWRKYERDSNMISYMRYYCWKRNVRYDEKVIKEILNELTGYIVNPARVVCPYLKRVGENSDRYMERELNLLKDSRSRSN